MMRFRSVRSTLFATLCLVSTNGFARDLNITLIYTEGGGGHKTVKEAFKDAISAQSTEENRIHFREIDPPMSTCAGRLATEYWDRCFQDSHYDLLDPAMGAKDVVEKHILPAVGALDNLLKLEPIRRQMGVLLPMESLIMKDGRPDMIISVINSGNSQFLKVAEKYEIPFRIGFTDYKIDSFIDGIDNSDGSRSRKQLEVYAPSDAPEVIDQLKAKGIPYVVTGYPIDSKTTGLASDLRLRKAETIAKIQNKLDEYRVFKNDSVLFVMMGAKGFDMNATQKYLQVIQKRGSDLHQNRAMLHVFLAPGKNESLRHFGNTLAKGNNSDVHFHTLSFLPSEEVAEFMGIYQLGNPYLMFTKPGGSTTGQAEAMGTPVLYSLNPIQHERFNAELMRRNGFAETIDMAYRARTLHPQKIVEIVAKETQDKASELTKPIQQNPLVQEFGRFWPFPQFQTAAQNVQQLVQQAKDVSQSAFNTLPPLISNQDIVDGEKFVALLRKFLVEGEKLRTPPPNRFSEILGELIIRDLQ